MNDFIAPLTPLPTLGAADSLSQIANASSAVATPSAGAATPSFAQWMTQGVEGVNASLATSEAGLQSLALGNMQNLHQVMMQLEQSRLSFQLLMQVRGRLLDAYQDVMKMPV